MDGNLRRNLSLKVYWCPVFLSEADFLFLLHHFVSVKLAGVPSFGAKIGVAIASPVFVSMWRQLDLFVSEEPDMVAIGVKFRELLAAYEGKQLIPPERPRC